MTDREQYEETADRLRDELLVTLRELERRRGAALDVKLQLRRHPAVAWGLGTALALSLGAAIGLLVFRRSHRRHTLPLRRWEGLRRAWQHPDRIASRAAERPIPWQLARKAALTFGGTLALQLARRSALGLARAGRLA